MSNATILQRFPTERFKRFGTTSPRITILLMYLILMGLKLGGIFSLKTAMGLTSRLFPFMIWSPISSLLQSVNNLAHGRKKTKATVMIAAISLSAVIGGLLGYFVLSHSLFFFPLIRGFLGATIFSPILLSLCMLTGSLLAHTMNMKPWEGAVAGIVAGLFASISLLLMSIQIPLIVDVVYISGISLAFITSIVAKQSLRAYYKYQYGHSNADGYQMDRAEHAQNVFEEEQSKRFGVSQSDFKKLTTYCKDQIQVIKNQAFFYQSPDNESPHQEKSNSFKDIYHGLMNPKSNPEDIKSIKELLNVSARSSLKSDTYKFRYTLKLLDASSRTLRSDLSSRTFFHQTHLHPGIDDTLVAPFLKT